jgi:hypothetical protein
MLWSVTWLRRNRAIVRAVAAALVGAGLALTCPHLPERFRLPCVAAVRLWRALT